MQNETTHDWLSPAEIKAGMVAVAESVEPYNKLIEILKARAKRPQTYLEILEEHRKQTGSYLPINNHMDKLLWDDFLLQSDPDVKEELARLMINNYTGPKIDTRDIHELFLDYGGDRETSQWL